MTTVVVACAGPASVVAVRGARADARGFQSVGIVGFRAHCAGCGYLGAKHDNWFNANHDRQAHRGQQRR